MGQWLNKMERKFGKYAVKNLVLYLIAGYAAGYLFLLIRPAILYYLTLEPYYIMKGQIWRLVTWVLIPPSGGLSGINLIFGIIMMVFYYQLGTTLERTWGTFRFNVYIFGGLLFTILGAFLLHGVYTGLYGRDYVLAVGQIGSMFSTVYINESIFLAFAVMYPDMQVLLYFFIPVKMKWMAIFYAVILVINVVLSSWAGKVAIIASLLNFVIFFVGTRNLPRFSPGQTARKARQTFRPGGQTFAGTVRTDRGAALRRGSGRNPAKHRCAVCGRTDQSDPQLEFRFCSRCNGNYEYCQDHLFTHTHIK